MALTMDYQPQVAYQAAFSINEEDLMKIRGSHFDATTVHLDELAIGRTRYPVRRKLEGYFFPASGELIVDGFGASFRGKGDNQQDAIDDFRMKVHRRFQDLMYRRTFEMDPQDQQDWRTLCQMIDETSFRNSLPIQMQQFGTIEYQRRSWPSAIRWDSGRVEVVDPNDVKSAEYLTFLHGQPVEAIVERDRLTDQIISIPFITRIRSLRTGPEISQSLNDRIGSSSDYPEADWD